MMEYDIAVVGGGPAGMMAAIAAKSSDVILLEKNPSLGRKLLLTGGGRCNITNLKPTKKLLSHYNNPNFLKHSFYTFTNEMLLSLFKERGLDFTVEDNDRVFPKTHKSGDVLEILESYLGDVTVKCDFNVKSISDDFIINDTIRASKIIITTGGVTYPSTGCAFDNYTLTPHKITQINYGLAPVITADDVSAISGIVLEDVKVRGVRGNVLITHFGLTGPVILDISNDFTHDLKIDLLPDMSHDVLSEDFLNAHGKMHLKNFLKKYMPNNFIKYFLAKCGVSDVLMSNLKKKDRNKIIEYLKHFPFEIKGVCKNLSKITVGGVDTDYVNSKTMESKIIDNLYFAGETLNLHGPTGGYNLKLAFSTGYLAGLSAAKR